MPDLDLKLVADRATLRDFLGIPRTLYADDPCWVPPLELERREALAPKQPLFEHLEWRAWVAYRAGQPVARITAQIDSLHLERYDDDTGYFGMFECPDDAVLACAVYTQAESWLKHKGMRRVRGPFNLNINQEIGVLVDGFDTPPYFMMGHSPRYYDRLIRSAGYQGAKDMFAYQVTAPIPRPPVMRRLLRGLGDRAHVRALDGKRAEADLRAMCDIFNDAWSGNWGFVPFTIDEFLAIGREMLLLFPKDYVQIAELDGEPVAFIVLLPNINEVIRDLNGRLLPLGWLKVLWRLKIRHPTTGRVALMGVRKRLQHTPLGPALAYKVIRAVEEPAVRRGIRTVELSWILEDNTAMRRILETLDARITKRYRVYEKLL
jgi:hypothetical protein